MKNNTGQTKQLLEQALRTLPSDFALQGVRSHIVAALNQVLSVEQKRTRRENTQQQVRKMEEDRAAIAAANGVQPWQVMSLPQAKNVLANLDKMIQGELGKIAEMKQKSKDGQSDTLFG